MARVPSKTETFTGFGILLLLAAIAVWVLLIQSNFSPAILSAETLAAASLKSAAVQKQTLESFLPTEFKPLSAAEQFDADNLSDKINGKAELYLAAGFLSMRCQRFADSADTAKWFESFIYDMGNLRNAFAVYSGQRRANAQKLDLTPFAYQTRNAIYFAHGRHYVEIIASEADTNLLNAMLAFSRGFIAKTAVDKEAIPELALFSSEGLLDDSAMLLATDAFGFEGFNNVFTATYKIDGAEVTAFLALRTSAQEAAKTAATFEQFLITNGGRSVPSAEAGSSMRWVDLMGAYEVIFSRGKVVAGVHAAESKEVAAKLADALDKHISEASHE